MSHVFAYLRVSTDAQDVANQRHGVARYCADQRLLAPVFVEDTASGRTDWRARPLGQLITRAGTGDVIVVAEVSRLARSTLQVLAVVGAATDSECFPGLLLGGAVLVAGLVPPLGHANQACTLRVASPSTFAAHWFRLVPADSAAIKAARCSSGGTRSMSLPLAGF